MRDRKNGAWFVDKFCEIVAENAWQYDLDTMLGLVIEIIVVIIHLSRNSCIFF